MDFSSDESDSTRRITPAQESLSSSPRQRVFSMNAELAVLGAGQGDITRVAGQVVTGIGFVCAAFIFRERSSLRGVSTAVSLLCAERSESLLSYGFLGYGFLGYGFLTEATAALVITLACLLLGRDQHSAAVDDRGSGDSSTPFDLPRRNEKVNPDAR